MEFHPITLADREWFQRYTLPRPTRNCDLSFANIFCWQATYHSELAEAEEFLFIRFRTEEGGGTAYMQPVGDGDKAAAIRLMREDAARHGHALRIVGLTPEWRDAVEALCPGAFAFAAPRANSDYIYRTADLATLAGSGYKAKRNHINRFTSLYEYRYEPICGANIGDCLRLNGRWLATHDATAVSERAEQAAMAAAFAHFVELGLEGIVLYADGEPAAFTYGSAIDRQTFCTHIEKADAGVEGAAAMINRLFAQNLAGRYEFINREDDLGLEGLRFSKLSYRPALLLDKISALELTVRQQEIRSLWERVFDDARADTDAFLVLHHDPALCLTHEAEGRTVAMLHIVPMRSEEGVRVAYIYAVATDAEFRGRGLASSLVEEALHRIAASGDYDMAALIPATEQSERIYARCGFEAVRLPVLFRHETGFGTGEAERDLAMVHRLGGDISLPENLALCPMP